MALSIKIPTTTIDLDRGELHSSGEEKTRQSPQRSRQDTSKSATVRVDNIDMPPELVITSTQGNDLSVFERLYKSAQQSKEVSKSPSRRDSCRRCSPGRQEKKSCSPNLSDPEAKSRYETTFPYKQQYWRVFTNTGAPCSGSNSDQEQLLKACSEKLTELKKKHKLKKMKYSENAVLSVPKLFFATRRLKRKARSFNMGKSLSPKIEPRFIKKNVEDSSKKKVKSKTSQLEEAKKEVPTKPRKFRKGGIVSLATVHKPNVIDSSNNDEIQESLSSKKKKKRKKLTQLHGRVKTAIHTMSVVAMSNKKLERSISSRKSSSRSKQ